jgi:hypothetical protein
MENVQPVTMQGGNPNRTTDNFAPPKEVAEKLGMATGPKGSGKVLSAEELMADSERVEEVEIDGLGMIKIKPLSTGVSLKIQKAAKNDLERSTVYVIQQGLVEPKLTPEQIQRIRIGTMLKIADAINRVSGIEDKDMSSKIENF